MVRKRNEIHKWLCISRNWYWCNYILLFTYVTEEREREV